MDSEDFKKYVLDRDGKDYGLCPPPIGAQEGLNILVNHFLGEDWYISLPVCQQQANTEAIYEILRKYPKKKSLRERLKGVFKK